MATRTIKSAAGKSNLSESAVRKAVRKASASKPFVAHPTSRTGAHSAKSRAAPGSALAQRDAESGSTRKASRSSEAHGGRRKH